MGKSSELIFFQEGYANGQQAHTYTHTHTNAQHRQSEKCKSKQQIITSHQSKWLSSKSLLITNVDKNVEKREF